VHEAGRPVVNARHLLVAVAVLLLAVWWRHAHRPIAHSPGELAPAAPLQQSLDAPAPPLHKGDIAVKALARFSLAARVLSRTDYSWDKEASLAPVDLALGWGRMSDSAVLDKVDISQSSRFYHWHVDAFPIPESEIVESSANMHLAPADAAVEREIRQAREGDVVEFDGYLIEAVWPDGYRWVSSLSRSDSGPGACELVWVEHFRVEPRR
jgi:hypothetical protein